MGGRSWAAHADAPNQGLHGQGYIVHTAMLVACSNSRLTWAIIVTPMAPTLVREPLHRAGWVYEEKVDGWRIVAYKIPTVAWGWTPRGPM